MEVVGVKIRTSHNIFSFVHVFFLFYVVVVAVVVVVVVYLFI